MRKMLRRKLKSCDGVSLAVAMLMFMACAVVGTVVLTAATAVGGRLKDMTELDQRYYSAASAVALLKEELCGHPVTIVREKTLEKKEINDDPPTYHVKYDTRIMGWEDSQQPRTVEKDKEKVAFENGDTGTELGQMGSIPSDKSSFLTWMAVSLLFGKSADQGILEEPPIFCNTEETMDYTFSNSAFNEESTKGFFWLVHSSNEILPSSETDSNMIGLAAKCDYQLRQNGKLELKVSDNTTSPYNNHYTLNLTLTPTFAETPLREKSVLTSSEVSEDGKKETIVTTTTSRRSSTVSWTVESVG